MGNIFFISSRKGQITSIPVYKYKFSRKIRSNIEQRRKFCNWIDKNRDICIFAIKKRFFSTLSPMNNMDTSQYNLINQYKIEPPFSNTSIVSDYIGKLLRSFFKKNFDQYLNKNIFIVEEKNFYPFKLLKCFKFNIQVFGDGEFYIHLLPISKITSSSNISCDYLYDLNRGYSNDITDSMIFNLIESRRFKRYKVDLGEKNCVDDLSAIIKKHNRIIATFDYHFVRNYSSELFGEITENMRKDLFTSINFLTSISKSISFPEFIKLHGKPFYKIDTQTLSMKNNIIVGDDFKANQQSAAYHNGVYRPVCGKVIQPITVGDINITLFKELIEKFNKGGEIQILDTIRLSPNEMIDKSILISLSSYYKRDFILSIFTKNQQQRCFFEPIKELGIKFQIYKGLFDKYKLSNFSVKCIEKLGGVLNIIDDTFEPKTTYFVGVDLGHSTSGKRKYSNLGVTFFNNRGELIAYKGIEKIQRNEALETNSFRKSICYFENIIKVKKLPYPKKIIIHRDGKIHKQDIKIIELIIREKMKVEFLDIVEVIKSGYPIISAYNIVEGYQNPDSGTFWALKDKKYSILVTNVQGREKGTIIRPIIIKHVYGNTDFYKIIEQIYWLTKVYTNNLYNSTRLPATTEKANNICGTGVKEFISSYKA